MKNYMHNGKRITKTQFINLLKQNGINGNALSEPFNVLYNLALHGNTKAMKLISSVSMVND